MTAEGFAGMRRRDIRRFTAAFPALADALPSSGVRQLLFASRLVRFGPGTALVHDGALTGDLYLVLEGTVHMTADAEGTAVLWTVGSGGSIGAADLVHPGVAELNAVAVTPCTALCLGHDQFLALAVTEPHLVQVLLDHLTAELLRVHNRLGALFSRLRTENLA
jgi:CRP-like cAMP-binding protein